MPGKILGIDIKTDSVTAVLVEGGLRGYTITGYGRTMIEEGRGLEGGLAALSEQVDLKADTQICSIPAEQASYRNFPMPFRDKKKIRQAIIFEVETMVPFSIEDLVVDFTMTDQSEQSQILAALIRRERISECLESLQRHGIDPGILDINGVPMALWLFKQDDTPDSGLLLDIGAKTSTMVLFLKRHISLIRPFSLSGTFFAQSITDQEYKQSEGTQKDEQIEALFTSLCRDVRHTIHAFGVLEKGKIEPEKVYITGQGSLHPGVESILEKALYAPVERINLARDAHVAMNGDIAGVWDPATMDNALALALRDSRQGMGFNFRKEEFEVKKRYVGLRKLMRNAALFGGIIILLILTDVGIEYYSLKNKYTKLDNQISKIFRQTLPEVTRIVDPIQQMKAKIQEISVSDLSLPGIGREERVLDLMRDISIRIPTSLDVRVLSMVIDPETVQIKGETDTFNTVDAIKKGLEPSPYFNEVIISSANLDRSGKRVQFEVNLKRRR
jgi:general secretion pathway protein L